MARGRRADPPALQEAKGNPGRRRSAVQKRKEEAERVAELLAQSLDQAKGVEPPALIASDPTAAAMWRDLAPRLMSTHRLQPQHRPMFMTFCIYYAEWWIANDAVNREGRVKNVRTVSGSTMPRLHPLVKIRDQALSAALELSKRFGLTPSDEYALFRDQAVAAAQNPGLFDRGDRGREERRDETAAAEPSPTPGLVGSLDALDSPPPGTLLS